MDLARDTIGLIGVAVTLLLIFLRVPIGVAMGLVGLVGISSIMTWKAAVGIAKGIPYAIIGDWNLSAIPMFLLMGYIASAAGLTSGLFAAARIFLGRVPGSLASATILGSALFASASGSSVATAAAFSRISIPEMLRSRYDPAFATGSVAIAGTLGSLIPPSVLFIVYGMLADVSISSMFMAGVIPGILSAVMLVAYVTIRAKLNPSIAPRERTTYTTEEKIATLKDVWPLPVLIFGVLGGIFSGMFTATEAGAIGAALAILIALLRRALSARMFMRALIETAEGTAAIFIIVVGAAIYSRFMSYSNLPGTLSEWLLAFSEQPMVLMIAISGIFLLLGMILESISIMLLMVPLLLPLLNHLDINLIWFGLIMVKLLEIGLCTPPVGMNVYVIKSALGDQVSLGTIFRGVFSFLMVDLITFALLLAFPILSLWLPTLLR